MPEFRGSVVAPSPQEVRERVERGALLLDDKKPDWYRIVHNAIRFGTYNFHTWQACVAGTLELVSFPDGACRISLNGTVLVGEAEAARFGFTDDSGHSGVMDGLDHFWREEIDKRLAQDREREAAAA